MSADSTPAEEVADRNAEAWDLSEFERHEMPATQCPCVWRDREVGTCRCGHDVGEWHDADECWALVPVAAAEGGA